MTYDSADGYVLLFGGSYGSQSYTDYTWTYRGGVWTNLSASLALAPSARSGAALTYDPADRYVVLFGGEGASGALSDTWKWQAGSWSLLSPTSPPAASSCPSSTYDPAAGGVLLYNGGTLVFSKGNWTTLTPATTPPARICAGMAYDPTLSEVVLFGGFSQISGAYFGDTWEFSGGTWTKVSSATSPSASDETGVAYDSTGGYLMLYGGSTGSLTFFEDSWKFVSGGWFHLATFPTNQPPPTYDAMMTYDASDGYALFTGGAAYPGNATWTFDDGNWTELFPTVSPPARLDGGMTYDAADGYVVLFGGITLGGQYRSDTWTYHGGTWTNITASAGTGPAGRGFFGMTYDDVDGYVLLWGGVNYGAWYRDTWKFSGGSWTQLHPATSPWFRLYPGLANDTADGYVLLSGGQNISNGQVIVDDWKWAGGTWTNITAAVTGAPVTSLGPVSYDPSVPSDMIMGIGTSSYHASAWTTVYADPSPVDRLFPALSEDPSDHGLVAVGGFGFADLPGPCFPRFCGDTWVYRVAPPLYPIANATATPTVGVGPLSVSFTGTVSGGATPLAYTWVFGDGGTSHAQNPSHLYNGTGDYTASLTVVDAVGRTSASEVEIEVNASLQASAVANVTRGIVPLNVSFDAVTSGGKGPYSYVWSFGDGSTPSVAAAPQHQYNRTGTFAVNLTVADSLGTVRHGYLNITVTPVPPLTTSLSATPSYGTAPLTVTFTALPAGGRPPYSYAWNLGDGTSATSPSVATTYSVGTYFVWLNVTDVRGIVATARTTILATNPPITVSDYASPAQGTAPLAVDFTANVGGGDGSYVYAWKFGDGSALSGAVDPDHTYNASGTYVVNLTVQDNEGDVGWGIQLSIAVYPHLSLTSESNVSRGSAPLSVGFTAVGAGGSGALAYTWEFGDSTPGASTENTTHLYTVPGTYTATVTVVDRAGDTNQSSIVISVEAGALWVSPIVASPSTGEVPLDVKYSVNVSGGVPPYAYTFTWNFGDGTLGSGDPTAHSYVTGGTFEVSVKVIDTAGDQATAWDNVSLVQLTVKVIATPSTGVVPVTVDLSAQLTGTSPYTYAWVLGDGTTSSAASVVHTYNASGRIDVALTVTDALGRVVLGGVFLNLSSPSPSSGGTILGIPDLDFGLVAVSIAVVAVVGVVLLRRRRASGPKSSPPSSGHPEEHGAAPTAGSHMGVDRPGPPVGWNVGPGGDPGGTGDWVPPGPPPS